MQHAHGESKEQLDILEHGAPIDGQPQSSDRRLYMQFQAFTGVTGTDEVIAALEQSGLDAALYVDANDPYGIGVVFMTESADVLVTDVRC